jgi:NAD(P)H dehydrogenase (quinone)
MQNRTIAVSGASGKLGRMVLDDLAGLTDAPVVALSRTPEPFGASGRYADFDRPESLATALEGVTRLVLISTDALGGDRRVHQHRNAIEAAHAAGVRHVVYTSILYAATSPLTSVVADHAETERALAASGLDYTVLRNAFYDDLAHQIVGRAVDGAFAHAAGEGGVAYVTRQDCARAAATAVAGDFDGKRVLDITGPEVVDMAGLAVRAGLRAVAVGAAELVERLVARGMPAGMAQVLAMIDTGIAQGAMAPASGDFERLVGRPATALQLALH